ncbi:hypothetical protein Dimus_036413 [Dionaea muscipula]
MVTTNCQASRSLVFKAMLETEMKENISGTIKISDVNYNLLHAFVNYLYTTDVCLDEKIESGLLVLEEKYQVKHLKEHCESAGKLLEASLSIIIDDMHKFMNRDEYRELIKKDPSFVVGILEAHIQKQVNNAAKKGSS